MRILALLFLFTSVSHAAEFVRSNDHLLISDKSCDKAAVLAKALATWNQKLEPGRRVPTNFTSSSRGDLCEIDVTFIVPQLLLRIVGDVPRKNGPNSYNAVLVLQKILPGLRYSVPTELSFYTSSPLCRGLSVKEKPQPGDIGTVARPGKEKMAGVASAFTYLTADVVFSKGNGESSPYDLAPLNQTNVTYYRCESMEDYLFEIPGVPREIHSALKNLNIFEKSVQDLALDDRNISKASFERGLAVMNALNVFLKTEKAFPVDQKIRNFLLGSFQLRFVGIGAQLNFAGDDDDFTEFSNVLEDFRQTVISLSAAKTEEVLVSEGD